MILAGLANHEPSAAFDQLVATGGNGRSDISRSVEHQVITDDFDTLHVEPMDELRDLGHVDAGPRHFRLWCWLALAKDSEPVALDGEVIAGLEHEIKAVDPADVTQVAFPIGARDVALQQGFDFCGVVAFPLNGGSTHLAPPFLEQMRQAFATATAPFCSTLTRAYVP